MDEAKNCLDFLKLTFQKLDYKLSSILIKHGCSEYSIEHPTLSKMNIEGVSELPINADWLEAEWVYDKLHGHALKKNRRFPEFP